MLVILFIYICTINGIETKEYHFKTLHECNAAKAAETIKLDALKTITPTLTYSVQCFNN
jgi:hypothetical protein